MALLALSGFRLSLTVRSALGLAAADHGGTSDPYVSIKVGDKQVRRPSLKAEDCEPWWDDTFVFNVAFCLARPVPWAYSTRRTSR